MFNVSGGRGTPFRRLEWLNALSARWLIPRSAPTLVAGTSLSEVAIDNGLNATMVSKWIRRAQQRRAVNEVNLLPIVAELPAVEAGPTPESRDALHDSRQGVRLLSRFGK